MVKQYKMFRIEKSKGIQAQWIAKQLGISETRFFEDYIEQLFPIAGSWQGSEKLVIHYLPQLTSSLLTVQVLGQRRVLQSGSFKVTSPKQVTEFERNLLKIKDSLKK